MAIAGSSLQADSTQYIGDQSRGCACTYVFMDNRARGRGKRGEQVGGMRNVDVFTSSSGQQAKKYFCHRGLTGSLPGHIETPGPQIKRSVGEKVADVTRQVANILWLVFQFIFPKFQFGVGINLWRFRQ